MTAYAGQGDGSPRRRTPPFAVPVRARELLVLQLLARGYSDTQIAALLASTPEHVDALLTSAAEQLGVTTRYEAVASAVQRGLIV